ncbi:hypothetical protein L1987_30400 [Smallanthus sonchifolius]|uniref:Uncharacterized protein n=1 Tax=Smallanthus sonchifolius TaxID=185202 RepID=A0ACB9I447_9ASTR|nr:hypothetical protein L1987_30400 [Smallanthus sonchifolius]
MIREVTTVDKFQGQHNDFILLSLVTYRLVGDTGPFHLVSGIEEIAGIINFRMHQVYQALLYAVPIGKMVVLDLVVEVNPIWTTSNQFFGVPYFWKFSSTVLGITLVVAYKLIHLPSHNYFIKICAYK